MGTTSRDTFTLGDLGRVEMITGTLTTGVLGGAQFREVPGGLDKGKLNKTRHKTATACKTQQKRTKQ
jgi:hypothetical protein